MNTKIHTICVFLIMLFSLQQYAQNTVQHPYGVMPTNANFEDAKAIYDIWLQEAVNTNYCPNKNTMLRIGMTEKTTSEYMGHGMINVAIFDSTDERLRKMYNYTRAYDNGKFHMKWKIVAGSPESPHHAQDAEVDMATAALIAARKWPNSGIVDHFYNLDWEGIAIKKLESLDRYSVNKDHTLPYVSIIGVPWGQKYYINYIPYAMFERFVEATGDPLWYKVREGSYGLLEYSWENYVLPAWYVDPYGVGQKPNDPWDSSQDRFSAGPSRTGWRLPQAYFWTGDERSLKWAQRICNNFIEVGKIDEGITEENLGWGYYYTNGQKKPPGTGQTIFMVGAAGISAMAAGNQNVTDICWDWIVDTAKYNEFSHNDLRKLLHVLYGAVMCGAFDCSVQSQIPEFEPSYLEVSNSNMLFDKNAGTQTININSNQSWIVINESSWITVTPDSAGLGQDIQISVDPNPDDLDRTNIIYFCGHNVPNQYVQITQRKNGDASMPPRIIYQAEAGEYEEADEWVVTSTSVPDYNGTGHTSSVKGGEFGFVRWNVFLSDFATTADLNIRYSTSDRDKEIEIVFNENSSLRDTIRGVLLSKTGNNWEEHLIRDIQLQPGVNTIKIQGAKQLDLDQIELIPGDPVQTYTLQTQASNGSVNPESGTYPSGAEVILTATADLDYTFDNWTGDISGTDNPITITMDGNKNITANFFYDPKPKYDLTISATNGSVSPGSATYNEGDVISLQATPDADYIFDSWTGDTNSNDNPLILAITKNMAITANFIPIPVYNLSVTNGSGSGNYEMDEVINIIADPAPANYEFDRWTGDVAGITDIYAEDTYITITKNLDITATYAEVSDITLQAEDADIINSATIETNVSGYNSSGYVRFSSGDSYIQFDNVSIPGGGTFDVIVRSTEEWNDPSTLTVNGETHNFQLPGGGTNQWYETTISNVNFIDGDNTIKLQDGKQQKIDQLTIKGIITGTGSVLQSVNEVTINPNPATDGVIYIRFKGDGFDKAGLALHDLSGRTIYYQQTKNKIHRIETNNVVPGIYIISIKTKNKVIKQKILIQ